jgi:large subunit ribosomal protein L2
LLQSLRSSGGRSNVGQVSARHIGGGHRQHYRIIDFKRDKHGIPATVAAIEYDPNRSCRIALLKYRDGEWRYILAPLGVKVGEVLASGPGSEIKNGNALPLSEIPLGSMVHNVEMIRGKGGQLARSAGTQVQLMAKEAAYAHLRLPSGEVRMVKLECLATVGQVGNTEHESVSIGKAGRNRWKGKRPYSRGVAKNPHDHPMGGGEGKSSGGRHPCSPTGVLAKGKKTRNRRKLSSKFILKRRK